MSSIRNNRDEILIHLDKCLFVKAKILNQYTHQCTPHHAAVETRDLTDLTESCYGFVGVKAGLISYVNRAPGGQHACIGMSLAIEALTPLATIGIRIDAPAFTIRYITAIVILESERCSAGPGMIAKL
jgi:hypothetical protein